MRSALLWVTTQRIVVIPYGRFGTTYRSHLQGLEDGTGMTLEDGTGRLSRNVGMELTLTLRSNPEDADLVYFAAEA